MTTRVQERAARQERAESHWLSDARYITGAGAVSIPAAARPMPGRVVLASPITKISRNLMKSARRQLPAYRFTKGTRVGATPERERWGSRSVAYEYARWQLDRLTEQSDDGVVPQANGRARARMLHHLRSLLGPDSIYPTMSIDEDGDVVAEWRVLDFGLELIATPDSVYWVLRQGGKRRATSHELSVFRSLLRRLTVVTEGINPGWRSLFPKAEATAK